MWFPYLSLCDLTSVQANFKAKQHLKKSLLGGLIL